ncbi:hypothetical protein LIER_18989 [Lithospermum erythrorhizon]|uniref:Uncharacterized protein n=1 Tax=Lithospermum erythrorhizon TaxID=34254 RepID=A0AAV3QG17_LITER
MVLKGLDTERTNLKTELEVVTTTSEERAKKVEDLVAKIAKEKKAAQDTAMSWDVEKVKLIFERDASLTRYNKLEQAKAADALRATQALDKATRIETQLWHLLPRVAFNSRLRRSGSL